MPTYGIDAKRFSDISLDGNIDLSDYVLNQGITEDGLRYIEFCVPYEVLPIDRINTEVFERYLGSLRMHPPIMVRGYLGIADIEKPADCYIMTLFEPNT